ncbi:STE20-related kinase adapter protein alpha-like [Lycorma delicatula]|uniref:STE20-related kinase adapter protein alpha-like n=1 Tax=Lycorma delicatula TaxID=130591 RepID=UPI003F51575C
MNPVTQDKEKITKCFMFSVTAEKKKPTYFTTQLSDYKTGSLIGKSSFASTCVYTGQFRMTNKIVAIKRYNLNNISTEEINLIQREIIMMNQLTNPFIMSSLVSFVAGCEVILILPLMEYGSCSDLIKKHFFSGLPESVIKIVLKDVLKGMEFIHKKGIIHRSVRASHILIGSDGCTRLTGFRYAYCKKSNDNYTNKPRQIFEFPQNSESNLNWVSPEVLKQNMCGYNEKSDIYSLGITVCELANGFPPYINIRSTMMLMDKLNNKIPLIYDSSNINNADDLNEDIIKAFSSSYSNRKFCEHLHSFKNLCCTLNPEERPNEIMLLNHPLLKKSRSRKKPFSELVFPITPIKEEINVKKSQNKKMEREKT